MVNGTTTAFNMHGINPTLNKFLINLEYRIMRRHATKVVNVPNKISRGPKEEAKFANKHPIVRPTVKLGLKNTSKFNSSENLNCMNS